MRLEYGIYAGLTSVGVQARKHALPSLPDRQNLVVGLKSIRVLSRLKDVVLPQLLVPLLAAMGNMARTFKMGLVKWELGARYGLFVNLKPFEVEALKVDLEQLFEVTGAAVVQLILVSHAMWDTEPNLLGLLSVGPTSASLGGEMHKRSCRLLPRNLPSAAVFPISTCPRL